MVKFNEYKTEIQVNVQGHSSNKMPAEVLEKIHPAILLKNGLYIKTKY